MTQNVNISQGDVSAATLIKPNQILKDIKKQQSEL